MPRVAPLSNQKGEVVAYMFECPGCGMWHSPYIRKDGDGSNPVWSFNGDTERPTFSPSLLVRVRGESPVVCHSFVRDGRIQFLNDCTHELAGQTVDLPEIDNSA